MLTEAKSSIERDGVLEVLLSVWTLHHGKVAVLELQVEKSLALGRPPRCRVLAARRFAVAEVRAVSCEGKSVESDAGGRTLLALAALLAGLLLLLAEGHGGLSAETERRDDWAEAALAVVVVLAGK